MLKLTLEDLAAEVEILKQRLDAIAPVAEPAAEAPPPERKTAMTPKMLDFLRRCEEERVRLGLPKGPTLAERLPCLFNNPVLELPPDASQQVDHYLYGTPKR